MIFGQRRTFKNFINTNTNLLRRTHQNEKMMLIDEYEARERQIHTNNYIQGGFTTGTLTPKASGPLRFKTMTMGLGPSNNHKSGDRFIKSNVGFYVSNTKEVDKL